MPYQKCKIYSDGSHYIAIPPSRRPVRPRRKVRGELIAVRDDQTDKIDESVSEATDTLSLPAQENTHKTDTDNAENKTSETYAENTEEKRVSYMTHKEYFENLYEQCRTLPDRHKGTFILSAMLPYFSDREKAEAYVKEQLWRKQRNAIVRRARMTRKINQHEFNYFVTFTYDDSKHTEKSFRKKLITTLGHFSSRKDWRYVGVWERSPEKHRLHFHGLFYIPEGTLPSGLDKVETYSFKEHKRKITVQSEYFNRRFGRNDFETIDDDTRLGDAIRYLIKYLEKTGERIVYSKGLPQYFVSDIMDEDVVCAYGMEDKKLLLFDDFNCWDEGCLIGKVSKTVIDQMPKTN